jgi:hypothetical protein
MCHFRFSSGYAQCWFEITATDVIYSRPNSTIKNKKEGKVSPTMSAVNWPTIRKKRMWGECVWAGVREFTYCRSFSPRTKKNKNKTSLSNMRG